MKKIINDPQNVVMEMCHGLVLTNPNIELIPKYKIIKRKNIDKDKVVLLSGGGSGHEPAHAGFVGYGMLDAAICGDVFASPSQIQVYQALKATSSKKGSLLIIKNYSGDMMNFRNGAYLASEDGLNVDYVKVNDDIAVNDSLYTVGRRGVAGTVFVHKIAGAAAEEGKSLAEVKRIAQKVADNVRSLGFAFTSCTVPAKGTPTFEIGEKDMEFGVGIHGEPGIRREPIKTADELAKIIVEAIIKDMKLEDKTEVALLINGFGATPLQELYVFNNAVSKELAARKIRPIRVLVGNFMTSIDMAGASVSILKLDKELKELLSKPCDTTALKITDWEDAPSFDAVKLTKNERVPNYHIETDSESAKIVNNELSFENVKYLVDAMSECIIENEVHFCEIDSHAGDGDFGMSIAKGFRELKKEWPDILNQSHDISSFLNAASMVIMEYCGGASGPIWGSAFRGAAKSAAGKKTLSRQEFAALMQAAVTGIQDVGARSFGRGAVVGDKTLVDAIAPCADYLVSHANKENFCDLLLGGANAAVLGAKATENIVARMGRAGTVGERSLGYPDAGAYGLGAIFTYVAKKMR